MSVKGKAAAVLQWSLGGVLISLSQDIKPVDGYTTESVTHGQCDAWPTVTFPATEHHRSMAGTKLYCLVNKRCVWTTNPGLLHESRTAESWTRTSDLLMTSPLLIDYWLLSMIIDLRIALDCRFFHNCTKLITSSTPSSLHHHHHHVALVSLVFKILRLGLRNATHTDC